MTTKFRGDQIDVTTLDLSGNASVAGMVTYETLNTNGDVGTGAGQLAVGDHNHNSTYAALSHTHSLNDLSNVNSSMSPTDGQSLVWDNANSYWTAATVSSGSATLIENGTSSVSIPVANTNIIATTSGTERLRITDTGRITTGGVTTPTPVITTGGVHLRGTGVGGVLAISASGVSQPIVAYGAEVACAMSVVSTSGGISLLTSNGGSLPSLTFSAVGAGSTGLPNVYVNSQKHDGSGGTTVFANDELLFGVANNNGAKFTVAGNGDVYCGGDVRSDGASRLAQKTNQRSFTTNYNIVEDDGNTTIRSNNSATATITIPSNATVAFPIGTTINFMALTANPLSIAIDTDTLNVRSGLTTTLAGQWAVASAIKVGLTSWVLFGDLETV